MSGAAARHAARCWRWARVRRVNTSTSVVAISWRTANTASARVLEKCGFEQEGYLRKHFQKHGQFVDARLYALIR